MCPNILNEKRFKELEEFIDSLHSKEGALIEVLHKAQGIFGYLSKEVQIFISEKLSIPISKIYGVITFYSYFTTEPRGKYVINVCMGTACFVRGSGAILKEFEDVLNIKSGETTPDGKFTLEVLRCVGACGLAPVVTINDKVYGHFKKEQVEEILSKYSDEEVLSLD